MAVFGGRVDFCSECGSVLPLPTEHADVVECQQCEYKIDITKFDGIDVKSRIVFNTEETKTAGLSSDDFVGAVVERKCAKCGNEGMTYSARQTRSADEGQTVFYTCPKCKYQETEYS